MPDSVTMMNSRARGFPAPADHLLRGADFVGEHADGVGALGMGDDFRVGVLGLDALDGGLGEFDVDVAIAFPEVHFAAGFFRDPCAEVLVGDEEDIAVRGGGADDADGVAAGADDVGEGFDAGGAIDVGDDVVVLVAMRLENGVEPVRRGRIRESEQPASRSGMTTVFEGFTIFAVSAMKWTPQKAMTSASVSAALKERPRESPTKSASSWISRSW